VPTRHDPLADTRRLIVDGSNLLPALARTGGSGASVPPAALIGRLRAAIPADVAVELVFDGPPDPGMRGERIASGVTIRHAGRRSGDEVIEGLVSHAGMESGARAVYGLLVVTDDRRLAATVRDLGARTAGTAWLLRRLDRPRLSSPSVGNRRAPAVPRAEPDEAERVPWKPGRGATRKRGNPRRGHPSSGSMPS
jgi:hypothetical protein